MNKSWAIIAVAVIVGAIATYAVAPYFTESTVDEALPEGAIIPEPTEAEMMEKDEIMIDDSRTMYEVGRAETIDLSEMSMEELEAISEEKGIDMEELEALSVPDNTKDEATMSDLEVEGVTETQMTEMEMAAATHYAGMFVGVNDGIHNANGDAYTIPLEDGSTILRLENFAATNGPDLHVYLATDKRATDYIDLGKLKANKGNQNYGIPEGTDLEAYSNVLIWCEPFRVLFGSAELSPQ